MIVLSLVAPAALPVLMAEVWIVQRRTDDSGRVGIRRELSMLLQNRGFGSIPLPRQKGVVT